MHWVVIAILSFAGEGERYPLSPEMALLERDAGSESFRQILRNMIPTELTAEWPRAFNRDDARSFAELHGGVEKVKADPELRRAYERRQKIVDAFLEVVRAEYRRRGQPAPFDQGATASLVPQGKGRGGKERRIEVVHPHPGAATQWYRFRGPSGQGNTAETRPPLRWSATDNIAWKQRLPGPGNSSPILWDDHLLVTCADRAGQQRMLVSLHAGDGSVRWERTVKAERKEKSVIAKNGYASATPATDGERVVAFFGNAGMVCFDLEGRELWKTDLGAFDGMHGPGASPVLFDQLVLFNQDQSTGPSLTVALDKKTGAVVWRKDRGRAMGWCTPVVLRIEGREELLLVSNKQVLAYDPRTGAELWSCDGPTHEPVPSIVAGHGLLFSTSGRNGPTLAIEPVGRGNVTATHLVWSAVRGGPHVPSPVLTGELLYLINDRGILTCLEATSGKTQFQTRLEGQFSASPIAAGPYVFFASEQGKTYVVRAGRQFELAAVNDLGEPILASLALHAGRLYIRTPETVYCVGEKDTSAAAASGSSRR